MCPVFFSNFLATSETQQEKTIGPKATFINQVNKAILLLLTMGLPQAISDS